MFFEDEKENIGNNSDMQIDNDTTSWDGILDDGDDDLISIKDSSSQNQDFSDEDEFSGLSTMGLDDELKLIDDDVISDNVEDVDDDELARILNDEPSPKEKAFDAFGNGSDANNNDIIEEDFNMDDELGDLAPQQQYDYSPEEEYQQAPQEEQGYQPQQEPVQDEDDDEIVYQPQQTQKKQGTSPLLLAVFFATMAAFGVYWFLGQNKDEATGPIQPVSNFSQDDNQNIADDSQENIPVVNEEEVDMIKPDIPEKKEVINVQSAGKVNPFLPIQKYIAVNTNTETIYNYDAVTISKPPSDYGEMSEVTTKLMSISVSGIMYDDVKPSAIITLDDNDYFVQKGDKLDDYRVVEIARNNVKIALGNNIYKANLGEEFKIDTFYGNAKYLPSKQGGGRQYYSVSEEEMENTKSPKRTSSSRSSRYTSEDDVNINQRYR